VRLSTIGATTENGGGGRRRRLLVVVVAVAAAFGLLAAAALGAFGPAVTLSASGASSPAVATDSDGDSTAVWVRGNGSGHLQVQARQVSKSGALGATKNVSLAASDSTSPQVASDADGDSTVVWVGEDGGNQRIEARLISAAGTLGSIRKVSAAGEDSSDPQVATDDSGDSIVVWVGGEGRIHARTIDADGTLGSTLNVSPSGSSAFSPGVATDADGDAIAIWAAFVGAHTRLQERQISSSGALGTVHSLSPANADTFEGDVATDPAGDSIAIWEPNGENGLFAVQAKRISAGGAVGALQTVSTLSPSEYPAQVAIDASGDAVATWTKTNASFVRRAEARTISAADDLGPIKSLSKNSESAATPTVATDADGDSVVAWVDSGGSRGNLHARDISAESVLGPEQTLGATRTDLSDPPALATADVGDSIAAWETTSSRIEGAQDGG
jgi:hypothetical protein